VLDFGIHHKSNTMNINPVESAELLNQIKKDNDYYKSIIENNSFYIIKTDLEGRYTYLNPFFCHMLTVKSEDWIGRESLELVVAEDHQICFETVEKCFSASNETHWVILRKPLPNGSVISTQWEFKMMKDENDNPVEIVCIGHDITPLIMKQQELQALVDITSAQNKQLVNFTYIISHNIRSHVANIIGIIDLNDTDNEEDRAMTWSLIKRSAKSLDATIYNLSDIITIQSNTNLPTQTLNLKDEIQLTVESFEVLIRDANATINYNFNNQAELTTNTAYFDSIVLNLFTNAIKYKSPERDLDIDISFYKKDNYDVLLFKDNGVGIDLDTHGEMIFGMYKTFHGNLDAKGLGLFIIKTQIEAMGGKIEVESKLNQFTSFKVYFKQD